MSIFYTAGHSTRPIDEFLQMLEYASINLLVDVRRFPHSRRNPDYDLERLPVELGQCAIEYLHVPALGGRRGKQAGVPAELNAMWRNQSFHRYADYTQSSDFEAALTMLTEQGRQYTPVLMCSEAVWWRCHRRIITDYLLARTHQVFHLMGARRMQEAVLTPGACITPDGKVIYPETQDVPADA